MARQLVELAILLCLAAAGCATALAPPLQPPATLAASGINMSTFLERADMVWDWELHANQSEVEAQYVRHEATCAQRESDPSYRRLAGAVRCAPGNLSGCVAQAAALCDANEWCAAVQRNASAPQDELLLYGSAFPLAACSEGTTWTKSPFDRAPTTFNQGGFAGNTTVVLWGDHNDWTKHTNYESATRAPLLVRSPAHPQSHGSVITALTQHLDVFPTLRRVVRRAGLPLRAACCAAWRGCRCAQRAALRP